MIKRSPIKRSPVKRSGKPIKRSNPKRRASEFKRAYHSKERVEFVRNLPCCACRDAGYSENAHTENGGTGYKANFDKIAPLCPLCHRNRLHLWGRQQFEAYFHIELDTEAAKTEKLWLEHSNPATPQREPQ